jgi:transposase InsO family protein
VAAANRQVLAHWAVQQGNTTKIYQTDGAKEYKSGIMAEWYANQGITRQETVRYTPQHNDIAERYNHVLFDRVRTCLFELHLGPEFWMECLTNANDKANHTLHSTTGKVPAAESFGTTSDVSSFQPFGQHEYVTHALKSGPAAKLKPRAYRARYMCYALLRMRPLLISWAECSVVISCGKVDYDKSG